MVAKTGSLSAAARELALTQPTIGRHIDLLERDLNFALFVRSRDGMSLTDAGTNLVCAADNMVESAAGFERVALGLDEDVSGVVRVSVNEIFGVLILPRILPTFMESHPGIDLEVVVSNSVANLLQRDADVAIRMFRPTQNDLVARKIKELPLGFFAHQDYLEKHGAPRSIAELIQHRLIGFDRDTAMVDAARALDIALQPSDFALRTDSILAQIEAIKSGLGIGVTHIGLATEWDRVAQVLKSQKLPPLDLWIACHSDVRYNKRVRLVMDFFAQQLKAPYALRPFPSGS